MVKTEVSSTALVPLGRHTCPSFPPPAVWISASTIHKRPGQTKRLVGWVMRFVYMAPKGVTSTWCGLVWFSGWIQYND